MGKVVEHYLHAHITQLGPMSYGTAMCHLKAVPCVQYIAKIVIHVKNQPTYSK